MQVANSKILVKLKRSGRNCLSWVSWGLYALLLMTLLMNALPNAGVAPMLALAGSATEETTDSESEGPVDSQEQSRTDDEVVPPRQRGERLVTRAAPLPFLLPRTTTDNSTVIASPRVPKALSGGRHANRNGLGAPLLC